MRIGYPLLLIFGLVCGCWAALPSPYVCSSIGDPHIYPFTTSPFPLGSPGVMAPGYYLLASFGGTLVYQDQQLCGPSFPTAYCNFKVSVKNAGVTVTIELDTVVVEDLPILPFPFSPIIPVATSYPLPGVPITITHHAYRSYTIAIPEGYVEITPFDTAAINIKITNNMVPPPFGGLCGTIIVGATIEEFVAYWKADFADEAFGTETLAEYTAANPATWPAFSYPNPGGVLLEQINRVCGVFNNNPVIQAFAQFNNPQEYFGACFVDVAITANVGWAAHHVDAFLFKGKLTQPQVAVVLPTSPVRTTAVIQQHTISIQARDAIGNPVEYQGPVQFQFAATSGTGTAQIQFSPVVNYGDGKYSANFDGAPGNYNISITANNWDNQILGSPFPVSI